MTNTLAYFSSELIAAVKGFMIQATGLKGKGLVLSRGGELSAHTTQFLVEFCKLAEGDCDTR
jgi:hypothetical protein